MKVLRIAQRSLHNQEWFEFYTDFNQRVEHFGSDTIGVKRLFDQFTPLYHKADGLMVVLRKSFYTKKLVMADKDRDRIFRGLYSVVKGSRAYPDANRQEAAERLYLLLNRYKKTVLKGTLPAESGAIFNLLQDLRGEYAPDVALLALAGWVTAIDKAEQDFLASKSERMEEIIEKPKEDLRQLRSQMDILYNAMTSILDAKLLADDLGGKIVVEPDFDHGNTTYNFVIAWNEDVKMYRNLLMQRTGRRAGKKETTDPES
jgi:hypothetical protein